MRVHPTKNVVRLGGPHTRTRPTKERNALPTVGLLLMATTINALPTVGLLLMATTIQRRKKEMLHRQSVCC